MRLYRSAQWLIAILTLASIGVLASPSQAQTGDSVLDAVGAQPGRSVLSPLPFEHIDMVTGNLMLTFTDLTLPGNAGFDLSFVRTYNSRSGFWTFGIAGVPLEATVFEETSTNEYQYFFHTADGAVHEAKGSGNQAFTRGYWRFTKSSLTLEMPNGLVATYDKAGLSPTVPLRLVHVEDAFGNEVDVEWGNLGLAKDPTFYQHLGNGQTREVSVEGSIRSVGSLNFDDHEWSYEWVAHPISAPGATLSAVELPEGVRWEFDYDNSFVGADGERRLTGLTTPNGGTIEYEYALTGYSRPSGPLNMYVVETRTTGGLAPSHTWEFEWGDDSSHATTPTAVIEFDIEELSDDLWVSNARYVSEVGGGIVEEEHLEYDTLTFQGHEIPIVTSREIQRDGRTYTTEYLTSGDPGDLAQPYDIQESGDLSRHTQIAYKHDFNSYIRGRVEVVTTTVGGQTFVREKDFDNDTGFVDSETNLGVTTSYQDDGRGNVGSATDANSHTTYFTYSWGTIETIETPHYEIEREILYDGTVDYETRGSTTTSFSYDDLRRVTSASTNTSGRSPVTTAYEMSGGFLRSTLTSHGSNVWVRTSLDGFGRPIRTEDAAGVKVDTEYDGGGRVIHKSYPYGGSSPTVSKVEETYQYDALGRLIEVIRPDGSDVDYSYGSSGSPGSTVITITEDFEGSNRRDTYQYWQAFGTPGDARLARVVDADGQSWSYSYNALGSLTEVDPPAGSNRSWHYNSHNWLDSETHPESGQTTYGHDNVGNVTSMQDARGFATAYEYDGNNRLTYINPPGGSDDVTIVYDERDNRTHVNAAAVQSHFVYDTANRLTKRLDTMGGQTVEVQYDYNGSDFLQGISNETTGRVVSYSIGLQGRVTRVRTGVGSGNLQDVISSVDYHASGAIRGYEMGNGLSMDIGFDAQRHWPTSVVSGQLNLAYSYDHVGNVREIDDTRPSGSFDASYSYDVLDRLTGISGYGGGTSYTYDALGNRTSSSGATYTYDSGKRLTNISGQGDFTYTNIGSLETDPSGAEYAYTRRNMLSEVTTSATGTTAYTYDGDDMRKIKVGSDSVPYYYVHGPGGQLLAEFKNAPTAQNLEREIVYLGSLPLASFSKVEPPVPPAMVAVSLSTPTQGQTVDNGQSINLTATVTVPSGKTLSRVEYYVTGPSSTGVSGQFIGQATTSPYTVAWINYPLPPGVFVFTARAITTDGKAGASTPVSITVQ